jgi:dTDP-glucose 4,6-dehydratase/UDP-glucose 4-epimerase
MNAQQAEKIKNWTAEHAKAQPINWSALNQGHLLLTGCTGPFGLWILNRLSYACQYEHLNLNEITVMTRTKHRAEAITKWLYPRCPITTLECDIRDIAQHNIRPTHIIHGAATSAAETSGGALPEEKFWTLVDGTRALIKLADFQPPKNMVFLSSGIAYGRSSDGPISEDSTSAPITTDYMAGLGHGKRAAEFLLSSAAERWKTSLWIARCFSFGGPGMPLDLHYALGDFISQAIRTNQINIEGDGTPVRSYMHLADMAYQILTMLAKQNFKPESKIFNVGSSQGYTILEIAELVREIVNLKSKISIKNNQTENISGNIIQTYLPINKKSEAELNIKKHIELKKIIHDTIKYIN